MGWSVTDHYLMMSDPDIYVLSFHWQTLWMGKQDTFSPVRFYR